LASKKCINVAKGLRGYSNGRCICHEAQRAIGNRIDQTAGRYPFRSKNCSLKVLPQTVKMKVKIKSRQISEDEKFLKSILSKIKLPFSR
jgi:hypothetical protein